MKNLSVLKIGFCVKIVLIFCQNKSIITTPDYIGKSSLSSNCLIHSRLSMAFFSLYIDFFLSNMLFNSAILILLCHRPSFFLCMCSNNRTTFLFTCSAYSPLPLYVSSHIQSYSSALPHPCHLSQGFHFKPIHSSSF